MHARTNIYSIFRDKLSLHGRLYSVVDQFDVGYKVFIQVMMWFLYTFLMKNFDVDADVVFCLKGINPIIHVEIPLSFNGDGQFIVD
jgi:hypothetical protein